MNYPELQIRAFLRDNVKLCATLFYIIRLKQPAFSLVWLRIFSPDLHPIGFSWW